MTSTIWPQEMVDAFKVCHFSLCLGVSDKSTSQPDFIAPVVGYLSSKGGYAICAAYYI
jgi:hypothetical protein